MVRVDLLRAHGTLRSYQGGCRCRCCRAGNASWQRRYRSENPEIVRGIARHAREKNAEKITERRRRYYLEHRDTALARQWTYYRANRPAVSAYSRDRYLKHRAEKIEYARRWRKKYPEMGAELTRRWVQQHPERVAEYSRRWKKANREKVSASARRYYLTHAAESATKGRNRRARVRGNGGSHTAADIRAQYERQRGRCFWCKGRLSDRYHVDHVVPIALDGSNGPENIVLACASCNLSKNAKHPMDFAGLLL